LKGDDILYNEYDQELMISGIQHYGFCKRQWMLIHVENLWNENIFTFNGNTIHERVDDPNYTETRHNVRKVRSIRVRSDKLRVYGVADLVEIVQESDRKKVVIPYEYKAGKPKNDKWDIYQVCLVAMCLEEMMSVKIDYGYIFYHKIRRKIRIDFDNIIRQEVKELISKMHEMYRLGITEKEYESKKCTNCSMKIYCIPLRKQRKSLLTYYADALKEVEDEEIAEHFICDE
jgi:CRISPR-associated exonuclease Cas4